MKIDENPCGVTDWEAETRAFHNAARLYGVDARTMAALARSKILTTTDNIRMADMLGEVLGMFRFVPEDLTSADISAAIAQYDGDGSKPYCDLVYCGLDVLRRYLTNRSEYNEWRKGNLLE